MEISKTEKVCAGFNQRQSTCLAISFFGMFSFSARDFIDRKSAEIQRVWRSRDLDLAPDFMDQIYQELVNESEGNTKEQAKQSPNVLAESYLDGDDGGFENSGLHLILTAQTLGIQAFSCLRSGIAKSPDMPKRIFGEAEFGAYAGVCYGLFNVAEPYTPYGDEMMRQVKTNPSYLKAIEDMEYVTDLAGQEKILPLGAIKWNYDFFGLPFDGSKNRDMMTFEGSW